MSPYFATKYANIRKISVLVQQCYEVFKMMHLQGTINVLKITFYDIHRQ